MNFAVHWSLDARNSLAAIWIRSSIRSAVTKAQATIDRSLTADALAHGMPVSVGLYSIEVSPLRVLFEVNEANRTVEVVGVRQTP